MSYQETKYLPQEVRINIKSPLEVRPPFKCPNGKLISSITLQSNQSFFSIT